MSGAAISFGKAAPLGLGFKNELEKVRLLKKCKKGEDYVYP